MSPKKQKQTTLQCKTCPDFVLDIADNPRQQKLGLGGRPSMAQNRGMIFVLKEPSDRKVWMKNMLFAIDIIWLDADKHVLHIERSVSPRTYPAKYTCGQPAKYILELKAGMALNAGFYVGQKLNFDYNF